MAKPAARITDPTSCPMPGTAPKPSPPVLLMCFSTDLHPRPKATPAPAAVRLPRAQQQQFSLEALPAALLAGWRLIHSTQS